MRPVSPPGDNVNRRDRWTNILDTAEQDARMIQEAYPLSGEVSQSILDYQLSEIEELRHYLIILEALVRISLGDERASEI